MPMRSRGIRDRQIDRSSTGRRKLASQQAGERSLASPHPTALRVGFPAKPSYSIPIDIEEHFISRRNPSGKFDGRPIFDPVDRDVRCVAHGIRILRVADDLGQKVLYSAVLRAGKGNSKCSNGSDAAMFNGVRSCEFNARRYVPLVVFAVPVLKADTSRRCADISGAVPHQRKSGICARHEQLELLASHYLPTGDRRFPTMRAPLCQPVGVVLTATA